MSTPARVVVVGAGVAGLSTAWLIAEEAKRADRPLELTILEELPDPGGSTRTERVDGYLCEWGPNGFLNNEPATLELVDRLGLRDRLLPADEAAAHRFIFHSGRMHEVPLAPQQFMKSDVVPLGTKLRMGLELFVPPKRSDQDETVYEFGSRRLGHAFATLLLDPMVSGIFAGDVRELSLKAVFPQMAAMERQYGGLFRALFAKKWQAHRTGQTVGGPSGPRGSLHTFRDGMGELTATLAERLQAELCTGVCARAVQHDAPGWTVRTAGETYVADAVVLACPSHAASGIVAQLAPEVARALDEIAHPPIDVVCFGYRDGDLRRPIRGFGVLVPRVEGIRSLGTLLSDQIFPGQAPQGHRLLRTMIGGAHDPGIAKLSLDDLEAAVRRDLDTLFGAVEPPRFRHVIRWPRGIAQYTVGHLERVAKTEQLEADLPGLFFTGASYRGVSVNGCVKDAFRVSRRVWEVIGG